MAETVKGLNIKLSLDGKDLENELKGIQSDLKEQQKNIKAINANLKYNSSNVELWKQKQSKLNDILQTTKKKLETQNQELEKAKQAVKLGQMSETEFNKLARNVAYTEAEVSKLNRELQNTKGKITELSNANFEKIGKLGSTLTKSVTVPVLGAISTLSALAEGTKWLRFQCRKSKVMYINLEINRNSLIHRFMDIYEALRIKPKNAHSISIWNLRGSSKPLDELKIEHTNLNMKQVP